MEYVLDVTVEDGKYTIRQDARGRVEALRYGGEWPAFKDRGPDNLHLALAWEVQTLREKLAALSVA